VLAACAAVAVAAIAFGAWRWWPSASSGDPGFAEAGGSAAASVAGPAAASPSEGGSTDASSGSSPGAGAATPVALYVHVVGAVRRPGLYRVPPGARVADAVDAAGGLLGNAAQSAVNLARPLADGEQVAIPTQEEAARSPTAGAQQGAAVPQPPGQSGQPGDGSATTRVNINTADATLLDTLPGVGPSTAAKIVAEREQNGPFATPDDLARVAGIGPKKLETLRDLVVTQ